MSHLKSSAFDVYSINSAQIFTFLWDQQSLQWKYEWYKEYLKKPEKANNFQNFFAAVGRKIRNQLKENIAKKLHQFPNLYNFHFSEKKEETVTKIIKDINEKVATGEDNLNAKLIKHCNEIITPYLTKIINLGFKTNHFFKKWNLWYMKQ